MALRSLLTTATWITAGLCTVFEATRDIPEGWAELDRRPAPSDPLRFSIALRQPNIDGVRQRIGTDSHISQGEASALRAPDQQDVDDVLQWLKSNSITDVTPKYDWIKVGTSVEQAESLLEMKLARFVFEERSPVLRTRSYAIPDSLSQAIQFIHPIANFMTPKNDLSSPSPPLEGRALRQRDTPCALETNPDCIRGLYNMSYATNGSSPIRFGVAGFLEQYANYMDVQRFLNGTASSIASTGYSFSVELINEGENLQNPRQAGEEAALDMEYAMALGYPTETTYYSTGGRGVQLGDDGNPLPDENVDNEPYHELLEYLLDKPDNEIPHVLSISYADDELSVPPSYAERVCNYFGLLTARGTSVLSGSGDGGARGGQSSSCRTNDGTNRDVTMSTFPASCPWVTSVGATTNAADPVSGADFSGGGFSQYFQRPAWQDASVEGYVAALDGHLDGYYNASMRAVPDISAIGTRFLIIQAGAPTALQGTSASTPVVAAMIALVNDARVRRGKKVLGWLNGRLYSDEVRAALQDVTAGESKSCVFQDGNTPGGWPAKEGYDAITGLGVPADFPEFMRVLVDA